jgi:signal transduction histidine kinase
LLVGANRGGIGGAPQGTTIFQMRLWKQQPEMVRDAVGAAVLVAVFLISQQRFGPGGSGVRAITVVVVMGVAVTVRRRWPLATYVAALLTTAVATTGIEFLAVAGYTLAAYEQRARPAPLVAASALALTVGFLQYWPSRALDAIAGDLILIAATAVLPVVFGRAVRRARQTTAELEARNAELVDLREVAAAHAVEAERFRIARELHDVVAHHVSAMTVRARAGRHVAARDPQAATDALAYVAETGTQALTAMGAFVGALRGETDGDGPDDLAPQPGLDQIPALVESFRHAGLVVHTEIDGDVGPLAPALDLNAYRIVEEGLTNALRHGGADRAWVRIESTPDRLRVEVDDNGRGLGPGDGRRGHGLIGIAERAALHGGTSSLRAGPRGGCRLEATLGRGAPPTPERAAPDVPAARP